MHVQNKKFHISTSLNGNGNSKFKYKYEKHQKYHIVIQQSLENGLVMYKIIVDGEVVYSQQNNQPQNFNNVMAYVSDPWSDPFDGCLENLELTPGSGNLKLRILNCFFWLQLCTINQAFHFHCTDLVSCGAQLAETCSDCPSNGCSGDCTLVNGECTKSEL